MLKQLSYFSIFLAFSPAIFCLESVNIYSYRKPQLINPMLEAFTEKTGIEVNSIYAKKGMLERIKNEGRNSPADVILTVDIGRLTDLKNAGLTQKVSSLEIYKNIPKKFSGQRWTLVRFNYSCSSYCRFKRTSTAGHP